MKKVKDRIRPIIRTASSVPDEVLGCLRNKRVFALVQSDGVGNADIIHLSVNGAKLRRIAREANTREGFGWDFLYVIPFEVPRYYFHFQ